MEISHPTTCPAVGWYASESWCIMIEGVKICIKYWTLPNKNLLYMQTYNKYKKCKNFKVKHLEVDFQNFRYNHCKGIHD